VPHIDVPEGKADPEVRVWALRPEMGMGAGALSHAIYEQSIVPVRERELARMRIAQINGCNICMAWRVPALAKHGVDEELYAHIEDPANGDYSEQERLAIEYADKFALDHRSLDDAFFVRMRAEFSDAEIVELTAMIGNWLAFGRFQAVLDVAEACAWVPPARTADDSAEPVEKVGV
jgi:AhpD family alkylhydroperoxidase